MIKKQKKFSFYELHETRGSMLLELMLGIAIAMMVITFLFRYQENAVIRAQNIVVANQMSDIQSALERYIAENRTELLKPIGRHISRIEIKDLVPYGLPEPVINNADKYQLRILKTNETQGRTILQGVVVLSDTSISPLRTREIVATGGTDMGFIEGNNAYGTFNAWHTNTINLGLGGISDGIIRKTGVNRDNSLYLWRVPSDDATDATMMTALNLGGHNIEQMNSIFARDARFDETLSIGALATDNLVFQNRTTIDGAFDATSVLVSGALSSDSRSMDIAGSLLLSGVGKFSSITTADFWVTDMTLGGISINSDATIPVLKINQGLDMVSGRINAVSTMVGFSGSITPRLVVSGKIIDSTNSKYYWNVSDKTANLQDVAFVDLNHSAQKALKIGGGTNTVSYKIFSGIVANKNATASDYMRAITDIQNQVRAKYHLLNLE